MDSEQWKQVDSLLHAVLQRSPEERDAFLRQECAGDEPLEREARSLLRLELETDNFLESPAIEVAARTLARQVLVRPVGAGRDGFEPFPARGPGRFLAESPEHLHAS
jgi:uncharacterized membrane protein YccC